MNITDLKMKENCIDNNEPIRLMKNGTSRFIDSYLIHDHSHIHMYKYIYIYIYIFQIACYSLSLNTFILDTSLYINFPIIYCRGFTNNSIN